MNQLINLGEKCVANKENNFKFCLIEIDHNKRGMVIFSLQNEQKTDSCASFIILSQLLPHDFRLVICFCH